MVHVKTIQVLQMPDPSCALKEAVSEIRKGQFFTAKYIAGHGHTDLPVNCKH